MAAVELSSRDVARIGELQGLLLGQRASVVEVTGMATDLIAAGIESDALVEMATIPSSATSAEMLDLFRTMLLEFGLPPLIAHPQVLQHLVAEGDIDAVLDLAPVEASARALLAYYGDDAPEDAGGDDVTWASDLATNAVWLADNSRVRTWLASLVEQASTDWQLARIGAGPLEDFVSDDPSDLGWLEDQLRTSPGFRRALSGAWLHHLSPSSRARLTLLVEIT